jgi:AcrR family transcriptional regulator
MRRNQIKRSTSQLLRTTAFNDLTLDQITNEADIPTSVFYHYFSNKQDLINELLNEVFMKFYEEVLKPGPYDAFGAGVLSCNTAMLKLYKNNAGLMRCATEPEFAPAWQALVFDWRKIVATGLTEFADPEFQDEIEIAALAHTMSSMSESVAYELYVIRNKALRRRLPDIETAADYLTSLWARALFLRPSRFTDETQFKVLSHLSGRFAKNSD